LFVYGKYRAVYIFKRDTPVGEVVIDSNGTKGNLIIKKPDWLSSKTSDRGGKFFYAAGRAQVY